MTIQNIITLIKKELPHIIINSSVYCGDYNLQRFLDAHVNIDIASQNFIKMYFWREFAQIDILSSIIYKNNLHLNNKQNINNYIKFGNLCFSHLPILINYKIKKKFTINLIDFGKFDSKTLFTKITFENYFYWFVFLNELTNITLNELSFQNKQLFKCIKICNLKNTSLDSLHNISLIIKSIDIIHYYPEMIEKIYLINVNDFIYKICNTIQQHLPERTRQKIVFIKENDTPQFNQKWFNQPSFPTINNYFNTL